MVVVQMPDGPMREYRLRQTRFGLRLERRFTSYDFITAIRDAGWRIVDINTDVARKCLKRALDGRVDVLAVSSPAVRRRLAF
jgi:hypothetical protein